MEKKTCFLPMLSLEEIAIRKLAAYLSLEVLQESEFYNNSTGLYWADNEVEVKVSKLVLPESLKQRMTLILKPIGLNVCAWAFFMTKRFFGIKEIRDIQVLKELSWTAAVSIDYRKTAANIVRLQTLDTVKRFKVACEHCLVDSLPLLWKELPEEFKAHCGRVVEYATVQHVYVKEHMLQIYWSYILTGQEYKLLKMRGYYDNAFKFSIERGNNFAAEYFFSKLSKEKQLSFLSVGSFQRFMEYDLFDSPLEYFINVFFYLYRQMTPEQQMQIFRDYPGFIFRIFLHWPWQDLFLDMTDFIWISLPEDSRYEHLLRHIRAEIESSNCWFPELFREFFRRSPSAFKKYFVRNLCAMDWLHLLDEETFKYILRNFDFGVRVRLVSCSPFFKYFNDLLNREEPHLVELCVREVCPSKEDRERLKEVYMGFLTDNETLRFRNVDRGIWNRFFESLEETDKKRPEDETGEESSFKKRKLQ